MTFFRVARNGKVPEAKLRPGVSEVSDFLVAHVESLRKRAQEGTTAKASFAEREDAALMHALQSGDDPAFLAAAGVLGTRLVEEMNHVGNPASGLLLCTTLRDDDSGVTYAAVLKLEVVSEQGAVLRQLDNGEETLAAVTDVLDEPGRLQKGLVFPDARDGSEAVVGDLSATTEARYFLRAVRVTLEARPGSTSGALVKAVASRAGESVAQRVIEALPGLAEAPTEAVLEALQESVPELTQEIAAEVAAELRTSERPVARVDTQAPIKGRVKAGTLTVTGPAEDIIGVTWTADPAGGWTVTFHSDEEPTRTWL